MKFIIFRMEIKRNLKTFIIWSSAVCGMLFLGMLFYPVINADGLLTQMDALFENPMMKGLLGAFGADVSALGSLMGFYVTYNSIYNVLLGCIFASILAGNLLSREEADKTAEFLFTRPVSRNSIFISKTAVLFTYITFLSILFFIVSIIAFEAVKGDSPRRLEISDREKTLVIEQIKKYPENIYTAFNLTEDSFAEYSLTYASRLMKGSASELKEMNLDINEMNNLIEEAMESPEDFFKSALDNPEDYMPMFGIQPEGRDEFLQNVRGEQEEYQTMKDSFYTMPDLFIQFFDENPELALSQFETVPGSMLEAISVLDLPVDFEKDIFMKYSIRRLAVLCLYIYLLLLCIGCIVLFVSLLVNRGRSVLGPALGLVFFFYFLNSISALAAEFSPAAAVIGMVSPFTWMDSDITSASYRLSLPRVVTFLVVSSAALFGANRRLAIKDILV
ncbi:MAG: ABC transporter permease [Spirochaetales bacterium]|nr:ABC transporter permease [Spirochaetales bacterium]